ncbi:MAG: carbohydrate kinase family protein [Pseudomonadota bacterium]
MKVLTLGGAMMDTIAIIDANRIERMTMANADASFLLLAEGQKTEASEVSRHTGGGAINAAVGLARLGADVSVIAKLGQDERAETIIQRLMSEGVSPRWLSRDGTEPTGASVMVSSHDRNAAIFTFRGANTLLTPADLKADAFAVDLVYVAGLSNKSADCFPDIVAMAKAHDAFVCANPGIRQLSRNPQASLELLKDIDLFAVNATEAGALVPALVETCGEGGALLEATDDRPLPGLAARGLFGGGFHLALAAYFRAMADLGVRYAVISDGTDGAWLGCDGHLFHCPTAPVEVAGTAGAGDAFLSTLSHELVDGRAPDDALRAATLNAASVVTFVDTQSGLLSRAQLDARVDIGAGALQVRDWRH